METQTDGLHEMLERSNNSISSQKSAEKEKWKEGERGWCGKHNKHFFLPPIWDTLKSEMIVKRKGKYIYQARTQNARQSIWKCHGEHR